MIQIKMSEQAKQLEPMLRELWDDDEFIQGVIANAGTDDNIQKIIGFINYSRSVYDKITADDISKLALLLDGRVEK